MDTSKIYHDVDDNERTIWQMVKLEPEWAANIIQHYEKEVVKFDKDLRAARERIKDIEGDKELCLQEARQEIASLKDQLQQEQWTSDARIKDLEERNKFLRDTLKKEGR